MVHDDPLFLTIFQTSNATAGTQTIESITNIFTGLASILLTGTLAYLYFKQHQVSINRLQEENLPDIKLDGADVSSYSSDGPVQFQYFISNIGHGRAKNLNVHIKPSIPQVDPEDDPFTERTYELTRKSSREYTIKEGNYLNPGESNIEFRSGGFLAYLDENDRTYSTSIEEIPRDLADYFVDRGVYDTTGLEEDEIKKKQCTNWTRPIRT